MYDLYELFYKRISKSFLSQNTMIQCFPLVQFFVIKYNWHENCIIICIYVYDKI